MEGYVYIEQANGAVEVVQIYETIEEAQRRLFNSLQEYVMEHSELRRSLEENARTLYEEPSQRAIIQMLYGLDHDEVALTVSAYEDLDWREGTEFHIYTCT